MILTDDNMSKNASDRDYHKHDEKSGSNANILKVRHRAWENIEIDNHSQKHGDLETNCFAGRDWHPDAQNDENAHTSDRHEQSELIKGGITSKRKCDFESVLKKYLQNK